MVTQGKSKAYQALEEISNSKRKRGKMITTELVTPIQLSSHMQTHENCIVIDNFFAHDKHGSSKLYIVLNFSSKLTAKESMFRAKLLEAINIDQSFKSKLLFNEE